MKKLEYILEKPDLKTNRKSKEKSLYADTLCLYNRDPEMTYSQVLKGYMGFHKLNINEVCYNLIELGNYLNNVRNIKNGKQKGSREEACYRQFKE